MFEKKVEDIIKLLGEDPTREGLKETPRRYTETLEFLCSGYKTDVSKLVKVFDAAGYNEIILLKDIELYSLCEHHLLPFFGKAHIAYIPDKKIIGISKLARIVDCFSRRMQIQERIGQQVTKTLTDLISPKGSACIISATHLCMRMRGVQKQNSVMTTSSITGVFYSDTKARGELMDLINAK